MRLPAAARSLKNEHCIINFQFIWCIVEKIGVGRVGKHTMGPKSFKIFAFSGKFICTSNTDYLLWHIEWRPNMPQNKEKFKINLIFYSTWESYTTLIYLVKSKVCFTNLKWDFKKVSTPIVRVIRVKILTSHWRVLTQKRKKVKPNISLLS